MGETMKVEIENIIEEIEKKESFDLITYYSYLKTYGKTVMYKVFNQILINYGMSSQILDKYFDVYFDIELENMEIDDETYLKLTDKYGEDNVCNYFKTLLTVCLNPHEIRQKYEKIYFYIDTAEDVLDEKQLNIELVDVEDSVKCYLKEIGSYKLLEPDEERVLVKKLSNLRKTIEIVTFDDLDNIVFYDVNSVIKSISNREQFSKLKKISDKVCENDRNVIKKYITTINKRLKNGFNFEEHCERYFDELYLDKQLYMIVNFIDAKEKLINCNLRLVVSIAKRYVGNGLDLLDLVSEGNIGLMKAVRRFDGSRNTKISTYATWWIKQSVTRYLADNSRTIRIPVHFNEKMYKYNQMVKRIAQETGQIPTDEEAASYLGFTLEEIHDIKGIITNNNFLSLDSSIGEEDDTSYLDMIADDTTTEDEYFKAELREKLIECVDMLTEKEAAVIKYRFGFYDGRVYTLGEVGKLFNVTRERIRQIEVKALRKLRHRARCRKLDGYRPRG